MSHVSPIATPVAVGNKFAAWPVNSLWLVPVGALLIGMHWIFPEGPRTADAEAHHFASAATVFVQEFLLLEGGLILLLFGLMALGGYLASLGSGWGSAARVLSGTAVAMWLPITGIPTQALPGLSDVYLAGHPEVSVVFDAFNGGHYGASFIVQYSLVAAVSIAGSVAMGVAAWRSHAVPRWCSIALPVGFVLNVTDIPGVAWVGLALMAVSGAVIARGSRPGKDQLDNPEVAT